MDHNKFDFMEDLVQPFKKFIQQLGCSIEHEEASPRKEVIIDRKTASPSKFNFLTTQHGDLNIHCNLFDQSYVELDTKSKKGNFEIEFDPKYYTPPQQIIQLEQTL